MKVYREKALRSQADDPIKALLNMWHDICRSRIGESVEVMIAGRRDHPRLASYPGELNTAAPMRVEGKLALVLFFDSLLHVNPILVSHELGHWILKLQDFRTLRYRPDEHSNTEIYLNSMIHHVPLYALQRSVGHDPQDEVDSRCLHNLRLFSKQGEPSARHLWADNALLLSDDLLNCAPSNRTAVLNVIGSKHPHTSQLVRNILGQAESRDLLLPDQNLAFAREVVDRLELPGEWLLLDESTELVHLVRENN